MLELTSVSPETRAFTCIVPPDDSSCLFPARLGSLRGQGPHLVSGVTSGERPRSCRSHSGLWFSLGEHVPPPSQRGSECGVPLLPHLPTTSLPPGPHPCSHRDRHLSLLPKATSAPPRGNRAAVRLPRGRPDGVLSLARLFFPALSGALWRRNEAAELCNRIPGCPE